MIRHAEISPENWTPGWTVVPGTPADRPKRRTPCMRFFGTFLNRTLNPAVFSFSGTPQINGFLLVAKLRLALFLVSVHSLERLNLLRMQPRLLWQASLCLFRRRHQKAWRHAPWQTPDLSRPRLAKLVVDLAMGQNPVPAVNIPIPTKIGSNNWWCPENPQNGIPLVLPRRHSSHETLAKTP